MNIIYEQVILTYTIINGFIVAGCVISWVISKLHDRRDKKQARQEKNGGRGSPCCLALTGGISREEFIHRP